MSHTTRQKILAYLGAVAHLEGVLLWPGAALHAAVALLLIVTGRRGQRTRPATHDP